MIVGGGGFGGLTAARELRGADDVEVTVVDRMHHHLFQPLLYQVACGGLAAGEIAPPLRAVLRRRHANVKVLMAEAVGLDPERRLLELDGGEQLQYDSLIVACGARTSYFGHDEWREVTCGLKTLADALALRGRLYSALERAERCQDARERQELLTFVVIGAGPTGVEVAGEIAIVCKDTLSRQYTRIGPGDVRVILLDAGERVVPTFSERLSRKAASQLASLGVSVRVNSPVIAIDEGGVTLAVEDAGRRGPESSGATGRAAAPAPDGHTHQRIAARTVVWAAGVQAVPFAAIVAQATGAETDRAGRVRIEPDLTIPGHREISMIGDATSLEDLTASRCPGSPPWRSSRAATWPPRSAPARRAPPPPSATSTRAPSQWWAAAARCARSAAWSCGAAPPSSPI